jgi:hypothetical protein
MFSVEYISGVSRQRALTHMSARICNSGPLATGLNCFTLSQSLKGTLIGICNLFQILVGAACRCQTPVCDLRIWLVSFHCRHNRISRQPQMMCITVACQVAYHWQACATTLFGKHLTSSQPSRYICKWSTRETRITYVTTLLHV